MPAETWRLIPYHVGPSEGHFALADALARHGREPTVWWHSTERLTLILGPVQRDLELNEAAIVERGVHIVRRQAGGTAVYAGPGVLGMDVFLPSGHRLAPPDVVESYRWLGEVWQCALASLGVASDLVSVAQARSARSSDRFQAIIQAACFGSLSPYEVVADGRKLVGLAQVRRRAGTLLQAAIHLDFDADGLARVLGRGNAEHLASELRRAATGLHELGTRNARVEDVMQAVQLALQDLQAIRLQPGAWTPDELDHAVEPEGPLPLSVR